MRILLIACGNRLRRDDAVAADAVEGVSRIDPHVDIRLLHQLTPEFAAELAGYSAVVFVDADAHAREVRIEKIERPRRSASLSHHFRPAAIVDLARGLFDFRGTAFLCRIPARDFRSGCGLTARGRRHSSRAMLAIKALLETLTPDLLAQPEAYSICAR
jgi:Ni,Fe-hydrogenase maturation factor